VETINEGNVAGYAIKLFQLAKRWRLSNAWVLKTWLSGIAIDYFSDRLAEPPKIKINKSGILVANFETNDETPKYYRVLMNPDLSDECRIAGMEIQHVNPKLTQLNNLHEGVLSNKPDGTVSYRTMFDIIQSTIDPWGKALSRQTSSVAPRNTSAV